MKAAIAILLAALMLAGCKPGKSGDDSNYVPAPAAPYIEPVVVP